MIGIMLALPAVNINAAIAFMLYAIAVGYFTLYLIFGKRLFMPSLQSKKGRKAH